MNEQEKRAFLKRMGYSGGLSRSEQETARPVVESKKKGISFVGEPRKPRAAARIEDMGEARKLYNLFKAGAFQEGGEVERKD